MKRTILTLMVVIAQAAAAQEKQPATTTTAPATSTTTTTSEKEPATRAYDSDEVRNQFSSVLRRMPNDVATILVLDPSLLSNDAFLTGYPDLAEFVNKHPEVRRSPRYFLNEFHGPYHRDGADQIIEPLAVLSGIGMGLITLTWLIRTTIEQRRWNRLSKTQSDVHTKILDRFSTSNELLDYMRTPAGTKFLESAPIQVHTGHAGPTGPTARILATIQAGVIIGAASIGMLLVSRTLDQEASRALFTLGAIALSIAVGFVVSAAVSIAVSKRLGLWEVPQVDVR